MRRLLVFLLAALAVFFAGFALSDTRMFFGGAGPAPTPGASERPAVEAALAGLDRAMAAYYATGDEAPARGLLADPAAEGSPLSDWRIDRHAWLAQGRDPPVASLIERRVVQVTLAGLDRVSASARERWLTRGSDQRPREAALTARYVLRRGSSGLLVESVAIEP